jgi:methyl-accepting chemotaxis protein/ligand-binding sensor domain-containing protein
MFHFQGRMTKMLAAAALAAICSSARGDSPAPGLDVAASHSGPPGFYAFATYDSEQGLQNLTTTLLAQDTNGYLWVGTEDGLFRYNGHRFRRYGVEQGLPLSEVIALLTAPDGSVWAGTAAGLSKGVGDRFELQDEAVGLAPNRIAALALEADGAVVVATPDGVFRYSDARFRLAPEWPGGPADALWADSTGLVVGQGQRVLLLSNGAVIGSWALPKAKEIVTSITRDGSGRLWVLAGRQIFVLLPNAEAFKDLTAQLPPVEDASRLSLDRRGRLWVPTSKGIFLARADESKDEVAWLSLSVYGFPEIPARAVLEDREGSLWISGMGLRRMLGRGLWQSYTQRNGLSSSLVRLTRRDARGNLWVGTGAGAMRATSDGWKLLPGTLGHAVRNLVNAPDGTLLMAGVPPEVGAVDLDSSKIEWFGASVGLTAALDKILAMELTADGMLWLASNAAGLWRSPIARPWKFEQVELPGGLPNERIADLAVDQRGRLWAAGDQGLAMLDKGGWHRFTTADGLRHNYVAYLGARRSGELCVAYREPLGISCLSLPGDGGRPVLEHFDSARGLSAGRIYFIGEDQAGNLWLGFGTGIDVISPRGVTHFGLRDGIPGEDSSARGFFADQNGEVWVATSTGLGRFLGQAQEILAPPPAVIEEVRFAGQPVDFQGEQRLAMERWQNTMEVNFTGLSFLNESKVRHEVRLEGLEDWHPTDGRSARYPGLAPGTYRFEVRTRQGLGEWSPSAGFSFTILPAKWQTWWAKLLAVVALLGMVLAIVRWRVGALAERNLELEKRNRTLASINKALRNARQRMLAAEAEMSRAAKEMLSTASQQSAATTEQAAAIRQASVTVNLIAETSRAAAAQAGSVLDRAQKSETVSEQGRKAVDEAVEAIERLSEQAAETARHFQALSERNERIGETVEAVKELAERSSILAINASLEAARAGEKGLGFLVVAKEMQGLAEASKSAAKRVGNLLGEVEKETNAAAAETESGQRRAQEVRELARAAGSVITGLGETIREFASAARRIADDTQKQRAGVEQVLVSVNEFSSGMTETAAAIHRIEAASKSLSGLAEHLSQELKKGADEGG